MYAEGMSTRDIQDHLSEVSRIDVSSMMISNVTNDFGMVKQFQDGSVVDKATYMMIGIDLEGYKDGW